MKQITRTCRGCVAATVFLNKGELEALRLLLTRYAVFIDDRDPDIPRLRRILDGLGGKVQELIV